MSACALVKTGVVRLADARITVERRWPEVPGIHVCRFDDCGKILIAEQRRVDLGSLFLLLGKLFF